ncbi:MAG: Periplasmic protein [uncultured bacterium (gcode 4)]|uniref:Periplasmic protein n=1 Tax=uncultured bacterium (gcode 4) TaxID=1234023 RepID=K1Z6B0_9BACT|nr:MAG: Periplasmic protein [uncultured bacterium (gcode 4)]
MNTILRTFISACLLISMGTQVFAYELTTKDQTIVSSVTKKLESFITKKWESYRKKVISLLEQFSLQKKANVRLFTVIQKTIEELNIEMAPKKTTSLYKAYTPSSTISKNTTTSTKQATNSNNASIYFESNNDSSTNDQSSTTSTNIQSWNTNLLYEVISEWKMKRNLKNGIVRFDSSSLTQSMVLSAINRVRSDYGLSPLVFNELLEKTAKNHSEYTKTNGTNEWHYETSTKKGFTGQTPWNRAENVGYSEWDISESIAFNSWDIATALRLLIRIPYHRMSFLKDRKNIGFCLEKECDGIFVFGWKNTSQISHFIYPKNASNIYDYNSPINETPAPFQWVLSWFVVSIMDTEWVNRNSLRLVDITDDKDIQVTFANEFSSTGPDDLYVTEKKWSNTQNILDNTTVTHFINREPLKEGHVYMTEYSTTNVGDNVCKIRRSYFVAGEGSMPDASKLLPTESSQCGNIDPTSTSSSQLETWAIDTTGNVYFISQKYGNDPEFNAFSYTDNTKKRNYNLSFSDADMTWLLARKQSTGQTFPSPEITGMYIVRNIHFKLSSVRKAESYSDSSSNWGYELYNALASIVR